MAEKTLYWTEKGFGENPGGGTSGATWGAITGTLSSQTDLNSALAAKLASPIAISDVTGLATALGGWTEIKKSADQVINSTTAANITDFSIPVVSGKNYEYEILAAFISITGTGITENYLGLETNIVGVKIMNMSLRTTDVTGAVLGNASSSLTTGHQMGSLKSTSNNPLLFFDRCQFECTDTKTILFTAKLANTTSHYYGKILKGSILRYRELT